MSCSFSNTKIGPNQQKLRMNLCRLYKDRNWNDLIFSEELIFYLKASGGMR